MEQFCCIEEMQIKDAMSLSDLFINDAHTHTHAHPSNPHSTRTCMCVCVCTCKPGL